MSVGVVILGQLGDDVGQQPSVRTSMPWSVMGLSHRSRVVAWVRNIGVDHVIVLARPENERLARGMATLVAAEYPRVAATALTLEASHLGMATAAERALRTGADPNVTHRYIRLWIESSTTGVVLRRVTRLAQVRPSIPRHLHSIFRTGWVVDLGRGKVLGRKDEVDSPSNRLLGAPDGATSEGWMSQVVGRDLSATVPTMVSVRETYGSPGGEFCIPPLHEPVVTLIADCPVCGQVLADSVCPFCRVVPGTRRLAKVQ